MRKRIITLLLAACLTLGFSVHAAAFSDLAEDHWGYPYAKAMVDAGYLIGDGDGSFRPDDNITVAEFVTVSARIAGLEVSASEGEHWASGIMAEAFSRGWLEEGELGEAGFDTPITRQLAAKVSMNAVCADVDVPDAERYLADITDAADIDGAYRDAVGKAYAVGMLVGYGDGYFHPQRNLSRAEAATLLHRLCQYKELLPPIELPVSVPILMYHHLEPDGVLTPERFRADMEELLAAGYETVFLEEIYAYVQGTGELPEKPVVVTFDDGYLSNYLYAYPVARELGIKLEISVIGWSVGLDKNPDTGKTIYPHFSWAQAREMVSSGLVRIQSHSYSLHAYDKDGTPDRVGVLIKPGETEEEYAQMLLGDCETMRTTMRTELGYAGLVFTYPYGRYDARSEALLAQAGYVITVSTDTGIAAITRGDASCLKCMPRLDMDNWLGGPIALIETHRAG